jgi:V8-like Glu-specific endopeptidase
MTRSSIFIFLILIWIDYLNYSLGDSLFDIYNQKNYGIYADKDGYMPVNFLTDNDITGGNSGSPVLNGKGELIGLAFDGNIEAMAGDVIFDAKLQRTINCDIHNNVKYSIINYYLYYILIHFFSL